jgi:hypothetical protein
MALDDANRQILDELKAEEKALEEVISLSLLHVGINAQYEYRKNFMKS